MKEHNARCITLGTAKRIVAQGRVAIGYPLPDGSWSTKEGPYSDGETVLLRIQSKSGGKTHLTTQATIRDERDEKANEYGQRPGCFVAVFPIG